MNVLKLMTTQGAQSFINCQQSFIDYMDDHGANALHAAALSGHGRRSGHAVVTRQLLTARCNVDLQDKNECTPFHVAATYGHVTVTEQLLPVR